MRFVRGPTLQDKDRPKSSTLPAICGSVSYETSSVRSYENSPAVRARIQAQATTGCRINASACTPSLFPHPSLNKADAGTPRPLTILSRPSGFCLPLGPALPPAFAAPSLSLPPLLFSRGSWSCLFLLPFPLSLALPGGILAASGAPPPSDELSCTYFMLFRGRGQGDGQCRWIIREP